MITRWLALPFALSLIACGVAHADYFLDGGQKLDLIEHGQITGEDGARYDIWIVPGYTGPAHDAKDGWVDAGHDFAKYGQADTYKDAYDTGHGAFTYATHHTIGGFAFKGSYDAWGDALKAASERTHKRVFGWWFAYPWAVIEASGESVLRVGLGVPGGIVIGAVGTTVAPVVQLAWPTVEGVYHVAVPGTVLPVAAAGWNTVISPPMAMLGQQPSESRADGFWVKRIDPATSDKELIATEQALKAWRNTLVTAPEVQMLIAQERTLRESYDQKRNAMLRQLNDQYDAEHDVLETQRDQAVKQEAVAHQPELAAKVDPQRLTALVQRYGRQPALDALRGAGVSDQQAEAILTQLVGADTGAKVAAPVELRSTGDKTDPLRQTLQMGQGPK